ncbi:MAG TPA: DUF2269 family protein [Rubrivivax sp.]|nr:DUF2269 family protein [Rubrivivax sp.]
MSYGLLLAAHLLGAVALGSAIAALYVLDQRIARASDCGTLARAGRSAAAIVQRLLMPGVLLLAASGVGLVAGFYDGLGFVRIPWLAGMVGLFVFQSIWANTIKRRHGQRLGRLLAGRRAADRITPELERARRDPLALFGRRMEPLLFALIVALGLLRPMAWGVVLAAIAAVLLLAALPALYAARPPAPTSRSSASVDAEGRA